MESEAEQYQQDAVWNEISSIIRIQAQSLQQLAFSQFKLAYKVVKREIVDKLDELDKHPKLNNTALQADLTSLKEKKSALQTRFINDSAQVKKLKKENKDHPRSLLILDVTQKNINDLGSYAEYHQPNLQTLENSINKISAVEQTAQVPSKPEQSAGV
ncbi:MAG: hypothetical protein Q8R83_09920 [Legionellaceae bacterium]|nr:hypothetical protein [Legionellaceae bacterium]